MKKFGAQENANPFILSFYRLAYTLLIRLVMPPLLGGRDRWMEGREGDSDAIVINYLFTQRLLLLSSAVHVCFCG